MLTTRKILQYAAVATVVLLLIGLTGWYFFLNKQSRSITATDAGRGLDSAPPSFGDSTGSTYSNVASGPGATPAGEAGKPAPRLWHVTKTPVAGMGFVDTPKGTGTSAASSSPQLYFAERGTGYILKADAVTGSLTRLTNKLFAQTYEAVFDSLGDVVLRSIDDAGNITSFAGNAPGQAASSSPGATALSGRYLDTNIRMVVPNRKTKELLLLVPGAGGGSDVALSSWDGFKQKTVFSSPLSGWKLFSLADGRLFLSLLPADDTAGYAFEIKNGALVPRVRNIPGLTFLPRSSSDAALFGQSAGGDVSLFFSPKDGAEAVYLPIRTVADKCVWAPDAPSAKRNVLGAEPLVAYCAVPDNFTSKNFLADWYRGVAHTSDTWWRIDAGTGQVTPLLEPGDTQDNFDVENPVIDSTGETIAFMDARDKTLWLLRINGK